MSKLGAECKLNNQFQTEFKEGNWNGVDNFLEQTVVVDRRRLTMDGRRWRGMDGWKDVDGRRQTEMNGWTDRQENILIDARMWMDGWG